jgi:hypothetical protein
MAKKRKTQSGGRKVPKDLTPTNGRAVKVGGGEATTRPASQGTFRFFLNVETLP